MKKVFFTLAVAAFATSFTSCKKDYDCNCTYTGIINGSVTYPLGKQSTADAKKLCDAYSTSNAGYTYSCTYKVK